MFDSPGSLLRGRKSLISNLQCLTYICYQVNPDRKPRLEPQSCWLTTQSSVNCCRQSGSKCNVMYFFASCRHNREEEQEACHLGRARPPDTIAQAYTIYIPRPPYTIAQSILTTKGLNLNQIGRSLYLVR